MRTQADVRRRIAVERRILRATVKTLLAAGYFVSINNSGVPGEYEIERSRDLAAIMKAAMLTDDEWVVAHREPGAGLEMLGWVRLVYGNDGWDVIADYSMSLDDVLKPVNELTDRLGG